MAEQIRKPRLTHVTITGRVIPLDMQSYMQLVLLAYRFRKLLVRAVKMYAKGLDRNTIVKETTKELNLGYADTIYKLAKFIVEGTINSGSNPLSIRIRRLFIVSRGFSANKGNRNIRLISPNELQLNIPRKGWVKFKILFGKKYIPLIEELVKKASSRSLSYTAKIVFRNGLIYLYISVPIEMYLEYFSKRKANGNLIAGFDINSDRINMVIADKTGIIRDTKTAWFSEVTSPGYPKNKAHTIRLQALARLLDYAYHHGVGVILFEDLDRIKGHRYTRSRNANRKITRFPKRKLLQHGKIMALKYGFKVYLVNPAYTSKIGKIIGKELGLDKHMASAYVLILKYLGLTEVLKTNLAI
ncbi:MAG: IS200/IS605 family accessory protein TnpB-related protein [Desulfurococcales archaeon]|nr:IS200/IS605 family accessory protein TnpB-related protein [Desulfurococcales archaeon]